ncbi:uncharacterized protein BJX67DRAFT_75294 [Aspergillus lucknowensis]|uniref:Uncharacterized protein n=1 Tax=Aspergillus lucknowensis TaxID=176173 RepID=A0ABR4LT00_9EURO
MTFLRKFAYFADSPSSGYDRASTFRTARGRVGGTCQLPGPSPPSLPAKPHETTTRAAGRTGKSLHVSKNNVAVSPTARGCHVVVDDLWADMKISHDSEHTLRCVPIHHRPPSRNFQSQQHGQTPRWGPDDGSILLNVEDPRVAERLGSGTRIQDEEVPSRIRACAARPRFEGG